MDVCPASQIVGSIGIVAGAPSDGSGRLYWDNAATAARSMASGQASGAPGSDSSGGTDSFQLSFLAHSTLETRNGNWNNTLTFKPYFSALETATGFACTLSASPYSTDVAKISTRDDKMRDFVVYEIVWRDDAGNDHTIEAHREWSAPCRLQMPPEDWDIRAHRFLIKIAPIECTGSTEEGFLDQCRRKSRKCLLKFTGGRIDMPENVAGAPVEVAIGARPLVKTVVPERAAAKKAGPRIRQIVAEENAGKDNPAATAAEATGGSGGGSSGVRKVRQSVNYNLLIAVDASMHIVRPPDTRASLVSATIGLSVKCFAAVDVIQC